MEHTGQLPSYKCDTDSDMRECMMNDWDCARCEHYKSVEDKTE